MDVSIIIVNYNTSDLLKGCLKSIYEMTSGVKFEVIVVDNASADKSCEMVKRDFKQVRLVENRSICGFGVSNNIAIRISTAKYVFLLNPDTILLNNAVRIFMDYMEDRAHSDVGCCGGNLFNENITPAVPSYGNYPSIKQIAFEHSGLSRIFRKYYGKRIAVSARHIADSVIEVPFVTGADMFIRRSALVRSGIFDEDFFLYYEDAELSFRLNRSGARSVVVPDAKIVHIRGASTGQEDLRKIAIAKKSEYLFFDKCYGKGSRYIAKALQVPGNLLKFLVTFNRKYIDIMMIVIKA
jgi:GT2 family glycosyltransferase